MTKDARDYLPLHPLEFRILLVLLEGAAHGYEIVQRIETAEPDTTIYPANLYRRIRDLLGKGLLQDAESPDPASDVSGRRRYLAVTALGRRVALAEARRLEELVMDAGVRKLLRPREA